MLITKNLKVRLNNKTKNHYLKLGYSIDNGFFNIHIDDLLETSRIDVKSRCDYCSVIKDIPYFLYKKNISYNGKFTCGVKCATLKRKEISTDKYGLESPSLLLEVKEKSKKTNLEKYGSEYYFNTDNFKNKSKLTNLEKYGNEIPMKSEFIKDKLKLSLLNKYGIDNTFKLIDIIKSSIEKKYGVSHYSKTDEWKEKVKETNLFRYGFTSYSKSDEWKEKVKETNLKKYGVNWYMSTDDFKKKSNNTNMIKYGENYPIQSDILRKLKFKNCKEGYVNYNSVTKKSIYECENGHLFEISSDNYHSRLKNEVTVCTICFPININSSIKEKEVLNFIKEQEYSIIENYRDKLEIDIYLPELGLGFEFNGLYWHNSEKLDKNYHNYKTSFFNDRGIRIIHIWEDDWKYKKDIIKSMILNKIDKTANKIWARKCYIKEISDNKLSRVFLNSNHIQGFVGSKIKLGLFYNDELVSMMTFDQMEGRKKMNENEWNLNRFCSKLNTNVVGGASKLFKHFIKIYNPKRLISYADKDWSDGNLYRKLGFIKLMDSSPDYKYIINGRRIHKSNFKKSIIMKNEKMTEFEFMSINKIDRIYDCGKIKFELLMSTFVAYMPLPECHKI